MLPLSRLHIFAQPFLSESKMLLSPFFYWNVVYHLSLQDQQLAKLLCEDPRPTLLGFAVNLILLRECLSSDSEPPVATQQ
jgi:hypothetical protein